MSLAVSLLALTVFCTIIYLVRLHRGLKQDGVIRAKNWTALTKQLKVFEDRILKLEKQK